MVDKRAEQYEDEQICLEPPLTSLNVHLVSVAVVLSAFPSPHVSIHPTMPRRPSCSTVCPLFLLCLFATDCIQYSKLRKAAATHLALPFAISYHGIAERMYAPLMGRVVEFKYYIELTRPIERLEIGVETA